MDYSKTLNLPETEFPMRAGLPEREPEILKYWYDNNIYEKKQKLHAGHKKFVLHDGPPYANGQIHMGTALNKILKDIIMKYKYTQGYDTPYMILRMFPAGIPTACRLNMLPLKTLA